MMEVTPSVGSWGVLGPAPALGTYDATTLAKIHCVAPSPSLSLSLSLSRWPRTVLAQAPAPFVADACMWTANNIKTHQQFQHVILNQQKYNQSKSPIQLG
jgi:hypothetical protein